MRQTDHSLNPAVSFTNYVTLGKFPLCQSLRLLHCKRDKEAGREAVGTTEALLNVSVVCFGRGTREGFFQRNSNW